MESLNAGLLTNLGLHRNPLFDDLGTLTGLHRLTTLHINKCPMIDDVSPLAALALSRLSLLLLEGLSTLSGLQSLTYLNHFCVFLPIPSNRLTALLPQDALLTALEFTRGALARTGLRGLSHWQGLQHLGVGSSAGELEISDWSEAAELPALTSFRVSEEVLAGMA